MRLGDLDALKEDFKSRLADCNEWIEKAKDKETKIRASAVKTFICEVIMTIDNTPTVEPKKEIVPVCKVTFDKEQLQEIVDKKVAEMIEKPQGEWVGNAFDEHHYNRCGHPALWEEEPDDYYEVQSNFCPYCGAKMEGGAE